MGRIPGDGIVQNALFIGEDSAAETLEAPSTVAMNNIVADRQLRRISTEYPSALDVRRMNTKSRIVFDPVVLHDARSRIRVMGCL